MTAAVRVTVRLDKRAIDKELKGRTGSVGRALAGYAGIATKEIKGVFRDRANGAWWPIESSITENSKGLNLRITARPTRPHRIEARQAPVLRFKLRDGSTFVGLGVNHPGSSPSEELLLAGIERAGRRLTFTRAAPTVTRPR